MIRWTMLETHKIKHEIPCMLSIVLLRVERYNGNVRRDVL